MSIFGTKNGDVLAGTDAEDAIYGLAGDDSLDGGTGDDLLDGGLGNDVLNGGSDRSVTTGGGGKYGPTTQVVSGGVDTASYTSAVGAVVVNLKLGKATGGAGNDTLVNIDNLIGSQYNDMLTGDVRANTLSGGDGSDTLYGGDGNDNLYGGTGNDALYGDNGNDTLDGGLGNDVLVGGSDGYYVSSGKGGGTLTFQSGGVDTASYATAASAVVVNLKLGKATGGAGNDTLLNIDNLIGSQYDDVLTGDTSVNTLSGGAGNDRLSGGDGNDTYIVDQVGDVVVENSNEGIDIVNASINCTLPANIEYLWLTGNAAIDGVGNDLNNGIFGNSGNNILDGGLGSDTLAGGSGDDTYVINVATNIVTELPIGGTDLIKSTISYNLPYIDGTGGGSYVENLTLTGNAAINGTGNLLNNVLTGNKGANILTGGTGGDTLTGGLGSDQFKFNNEAETGISVDTRDSIVDFSHIQGDKIDLSAIDANTVFPGNNAFSAPTVGGTFSGVLTNPGELYFDKTAHILYGNNDADSAADFSIQLMGVDRLVSSDFML